MSIGGCEFLLWNSKIQAAVQWIAVPPCHGPVQKPGESLYGVKAIDLSYNSAKVTPAVVQHPPDSVKHSVFHTSRPTAVWQQ